MAKQEVLAEKAYWAGDQTAPFSNARNERLYGREGKEQAWQVNPTRGDAVRVSDGFRIRFQSLLGCGKMV